MKISFYLRHPVLYARISEKADMVRVSTGIKPPPDAILDGDRYKGSSIETASINAELQQFKAKIANLFAYHQGDLQKVRASILSANEPFEVTEKEDFTLGVLLLKYLEMAQLGIIKTRKKAKLSVSSIKVYTYSTNVYLKYSLRHGGINLMEYSLSGKHLEEQRMLAAEFVSHFERFISYMETQELMINTRCDIMNVLAVLIRYWEESLFIKLPKIPKVSAYETPILTLEDDFLKKIINDEHKIYATLRPKLKYTWEICCIIMVTSLRISDAVSLKKDDFTFGDGVISLVKENQKTGAITNVPLPSVMYNWMMDNLADHGEAFTNIPILAKVDLVREHMEELFEKYPEMRLPVTMKRNYVNDDKVATTKPMYEWVKPHMLRKTAITSMLGNGVSEDHVKFASGHSPNSKSFNRYKGFVERKFHSQINDYNERMFGPTT